MMGGIDGEIRPARIGSGLGDLRHSRAEITFKSAFDAKEPDEKCRHCNRGPLPKRQNIGHGCSVQECIYCGEEHAHYPETMQKSTSPARNCEDCGEPGDTENGKYCLTCRTRRRMRKRWSKKNERALEL